MKTLKQNIKLISFLTASLVIIGVSLIAAHYNSFLPLGILGIVSLMFVFVLPNK